MDDLDELLAGLDNPRASTRASSGTVNYDELNALMHDLASPVDVKPAPQQYQQQRLSQGRGGTDGLDDLLGELSGHSPPQNNRNTQQPVRNTQPPNRNTQQPVRNTQQPIRNTQQPVRNTQSAVQLDDLDELLRNLGPPSSHSNASVSSSPHVHSTPSHSGGGSTFYAQPQSVNHNQYQQAQDRSSMAPMRNTQAPVRQAQPQQSYQPPQQSYQPPPQQRNPAPAKPTGRVLDGPDLDVMLADIHRSSTNLGNSGGPSSRGDCAVCRKPILGEVIQALNRAYHPEHFVCGNCQAPLGTSNFFEQDGIPNCQRCYEELFCSRCAHCDEPITGRCITALNRKWHSDHFICGQCLGPFPGGTFFEKEGRPYCENCFHNAFSSRCAGCNQSIKGECINALGQQWHPEHFVCQYCQKSFGSGSFYEYGGRPYCETHYHQQTGSLCAGCGKAVTGRMVNALDKKWHPEHFVCSFCMQPLAGGAFTENAGKAYCKECHGKLFG